MKFFEKFIKGWAVEKRSNIVSGGTRDIVLSLNNGDGGKDRNVSGMPAPLFRYYNVTAYQVGGGLFLVDDGSSYVHIQPALRRAHGRIGRSAMTYDGFTTLLVLVLSELMKQEGLFFLHSACVSDHRGKGWLVCGWPGAGKTTLSVGFLKKGFSFLSDDSILLRQSLKGPRRRLKGVPNIEALSFRKVFRVGQKNRRKRSVRVENRFHARYAETCIPEVLIHAEISGGKKSRLRRLSPSESFLRIIPQSFQILGGAPSQTEGHADVLRGLVHQCVSFDLRAGSDLRATPENLVRMVKERIEE